MQTHAISTRFFLPGATGSSCSKAEVCGSLRLAQGRGESGVHAAGSSSMPGSSTSLLGPAAGDGAVAMAVGLPGRADHMPWLCCMGGQVMLQAVQ
jgi:hypothetical protein